MESLLLSFLISLQLIQQNQFDTIYHEHFSYFSLLSIEKVFQKHHLELFDVDQIPTHGGSLRVYLQHAQWQTENRTLGVAELRDKETSFGLHKLETYQIVFGKC